MHSIQVRGCFLNRGAQYESRLFKGVNAAQEIAWAVRFFIACAAQFDTLKIKTGLGFRAFATGTTVTIVTARFTVAIGNALRNTFVSFTCFIFRAEIAWIRGISSCFIWTFSSTGI